MSRALLIVLAVSAVSAPVAFGDKPRRGLQKYDDSSVEVRDINKRPSKVKAFVESEEQPPESFEFPWKHVLGVLACLAIAAPFAWRLYSNVNEEIASTKEDREPGAPPPVRVRRKLTGDRPSQSS